ncbi:hypothetical protein PoMZ_01835 [Pyricularia oryzae]|uniref:Uncharacterized protein n=1 Tax=Pyricularia oryzae TaxID=318829 RepID=A0A4P7N372_PYROR|nr:hypothetical protein PoMZ_01835 [Pyricularia oryzae]
MGSIRSYNILPVRCFSPLILKYLSRLERGTKIPEANNGHPCALLSSNSECVQQRALNCFHPLGSRPKWM